MRKEITPATTEEERVRQYAEIALAIATRLLAAASLTAPASQATVSPGPEVEPHALHNPITP